jgi:DnaJ-class molecular chaperone
VTDIEYVTCPGCEGHGVQDCDYCYTGTIDCTECNGAGDVWIGPGYDDFDACPSCEGSGQVEDA